MKGSSGEPSVPWRCPLLPPLSENGEAGKKCEDILTPALDLRGGLRVCGCEH